MEMIVMIKCDDNGVDNECSDDDFNVNINECIVDNDSDDNSNSNNDDNDYGNYNNDDNKEIIIILIIKKMI